ncbi:hypothetical protein COB52_04920 [Candidatus Kaiserbacteria bacterium]|nr:MAG: hypothetical protein COB52_04920 [Candidatus Kaiserbacteria bacterium]
MKLTGFFILQNDECLDKLLHGTATKLEVPEEVKELVEQREEARESKDFEKADSLRDLIEKAGYKIEDSEEGPELSK